MLFLFSVIAILSAVSARLLGLRPQRFGTHGKFDNPRLSELNKPLKSYSCGAQQVTLHDIVTAISKDAVYTDSTLLGLGYWQSEIPIQGTSNVILISFHAWHQSEDKKNPYSSILTLNDVSEKKRGTKDAPIPCRLARAHGIPRSRI